MYESFFNLSERPFSITPNPRFVFLSRRHQDALAHLLYGVGTGGSGGFVQLTGEVGTGKTTLCRLALEQVPDKTRIALILNPMLGPTELLEAVCQELEVDWESYRGSGILKIHGALNAFLLERHAEGERVVLIIDEAQNLSDEALEQIRLLTNLETQTDKLLQIILIGQPELREVLRKPSLRQLAQRITARYHLDPLDAEETAEYVRHRLMVADAPRCPLTPEALKHLYNVSGGVPRLINIIADRALLAGYGSDQAEIDADLIEAAAREVSGEEAHGHASPVRGWLAFAGVVLVFGLGLSVAWVTSHVDRTENAVRPSWHQALMGDDRSVGWLDMASVWDNITPEKVATACENESLVVEGLACLPLRGNWRYVRQLNMPVLLTLEEVSASQVLLMGLSDQSATIRHLGQVYDVPRAQLERLWSGEFLVVWPDDGNLHRVGDADPAVGVMKALATEQAMDPWTGDRSPIFNAAFEQWVIGFQTRHGLTNDGVIGPATRLFLGHPHQVAQNQALLPLTLSSEH